MSVENIQQAFIEKLLEDFPGWENRIAWENVAFTPPTARAWMSFHFFPVTETVATMGAAGFDRNEGFTQITLHYPVGRGEDDSRAVIEALRQAFPPGPIGFDGQSVTILSRNRANGSKRDQFYIIPFTIRWKANIARNN